MKISNFKDFINENITVNTYYINDIDSDTINNNEYRKILFTGNNLQLVLMSILPGEEIGEEIHNGDQFIRIEEGEAKVIINDKEYNVKSDWGITIPKGFKHNVINTGDKSLKLYSIYAPPEH